MRDRLRRANIRRNDGGEIENLDQYLAMLSPGFVRSLTPAQYRGLLLQLAHAAEYLNNPANCPPELPEVLDPEQRHALRKTTRRVENLSDQ